MIPSTLIQGVVFLLALSSGNSGPIKRCRQFSIRFNRPVEQFGEHQSGTGGCLASGDSGGIRAGATDGGGKLSGFVAQPLTSSIGVNSASISNRSFFMPFYPRLLLRICAPVFFLTRRALANYFCQSIAAVPLR
jgi:hypothetical protein